MINGIYFRGTNHTSVRPTTLRLNPAYELYYKELFRGISQAFAPFLLMSFLNGRIIFKMTEYKKITSTRVIALRYFQPTYTLRWHHTFSRQINEHLNFSDGFKLTKTRSKTGSHLGYNCILFFVLQFRKDCT